MKVTVIGSHLCPDTLYALNRLVEARADVEFKNLSASLPDLKAYLAVRESEPAYEAVKAKGSQTSRTAYPYPSKPPRQELPSALSPLFLWHKRQKAGSWYWNDPPSSFPRRFPCPSDGTGWEERRWEA